MFCESSADGWLSSSSLWTERIITMVTVNKRLPGNSKVLGWRLAWLPFPTAFTHPDEISEPCHSWAVVRACNCINATWLCETTGFLTCTTTTKRAEPGRFKHLQTSSILCWPRVWHKQVRNASCCCCSYHYQHRVMPNCMVGSEGPGEEWGIVTQLPFGSLPLAMPN